MIRARKVAAMVLAAVSVSVPGKGAEVTSPERQTYVRLANNANAIIAEPAVVDAARNRIAILITHPEHANNFNSWIGRELAKRGYRAMMLNYYGPEETYEEFLAPLAAAVKHLRGLPGVAKVVLSGGSTGGAELTFYQDVAENGAKACQAPEKVYPCTGKNLDGLPKADGVVLLDINVGAPVRTIAIDPAIEGRRPRVRNAQLDMFSSRNGFDPKTGAATYSPDFSRRYFAAQGARANGLIDEALARLVSIEKNQGDYKDDEPFVVPGSSRESNGARLDLADRRFMSKTHGPHLLLKADGTRATQIVPSLLPPDQTNAEDVDQYYKTTQDMTVRHYQSFYALRTTPDYAVTESGIKGVQWRSVSNSAPGSVEGVRVPTLVMAGSCYGHMIFNEIVFDHSAAKDKEFVLIEGGNHSLQPCKREFGDTSKRAFDYIDSWLTKAGRL
jgi:hypothetical protein